MNEEDARSWIRTRFGVSRETSLATYVELLRHGTSEQNLISPATVDCIWARHIVDSAQLIDDAPSNGLWVDVGAGAGLPGLVVAILTDQPVLMVEPRKLRVNFLEACVEHLQLQNRVRVAPAKVERVTGETASVISARAVANLSSLFAAAEHLSTNDTVWLLPKGRSARSEVADARRAWQGAFHVKPSITDPASGIVVARGVRRQ